MGSRIMRRRKARDEGCLYVHLEAPRTFLRKSLLPDDADKGGAAALQNS